MTEVFVDSVPSEVADLLEDIAQRVEAGQTEGFAEGIPIKRGKTSSMVRYNGVELPERTPVYDKFGEISLVPTAQLAKMLSKPRADSPGERAFFSRPPNGVQREYISETCDWCLKRGVRKRFMDIEDLENHQEDKHPREYGRKIAREARAGQLTADQILKILANNNTTPAAFATATGTPRRRGPNKPKVA